MYLRTNLTTSDFLWRRVFNCFVNNQLALKDQLSESGKF